MGINEVKEYQQKYERELFRGVLPFWMENSPDWEKGGIFNCLDKEGGVYSTDKSVWAQGRTVWLLSSLYSGYPDNPGRDGWLALAKSCLDFLNEKCIDPADRRMYFTVTRDGEPLRKRRYFFSESFYIIGCAEYAAAAHDESALQTAKSYYDFVWNIYENPQADPYKITPKVIAKTRSTRSLAEPMILLNATSIMRRCDPGSAQVYDARARRLLEDIKGKFIKPDLSAVLESVGDNGEFHDWYSAGRVVNPGHALEVCWFILEQAKTLGDPGLVDTAKQIFEWSVNLGWDKEYDGLFYFVDVLGNPPEQYEHDMKLWWPHCEAIVSALMLYRETADETYFQWFKRFTDYAFLKFSDFPNDWYGYLHRDGSPTLPACKGSTYKSAFHVARMLSMTNRMLLDIIADKSK